MGYLISAAGGISLAFLGSLIIAASVFGLHRGQLGQRRGARVLLGIAITFGVVTALSGGVLMVGAL